MALASMLEADSAFSETNVEKVISRPPEWRKPDVSALLQERLVAFDVQLATTQLPAIEGREAFYEDHGIRYMWLTNSNDVRTLARQAFQDIYWNNDGQIFAIDDRAKTATLERGQLHLWLLTVAPRIGDRGLYSVWERRLVARSEIEWNTESGRPCYPNVDFTEAFRQLVTEQFANSRQRLINAVRHRDQHSDDAARDAWNDIARAIGAPTWSASKPDRCFKAVGVLASVAAGKKMDASGYASNHLTVMFNEFLEDQTCRGWTATLQHIAEIHGHQALLVAASTRAKIRRNLSETQIDLGRRYAGMLDIIFPKSAMSRLGGPPDKFVDV